MGKKPSPQQIWRKRNPKANWAHRATRSAVKSGLVHKRPCEVCGEVKTDAHHPDYERPLLIVWLCRKHHAATHAEMRKGRQNGA